MRRQKTVLVVDDDDGVRLFVQGVLEGQGWRCLDVGNGADALDLAEAETPDLIVLDVTMPVMDGFETFQRLRGGHLTKDIPILMMTGINDGAQAFRHSPESLEARYGVRAPEGWVDKPVDPDLLLNSVMGVAG